MSLRPKSQPSSLQRGFSLVELLVTVAIMVMVTAIVLARYSAFDGAIILKNQAYDIALTIRQVQSFGLGVDVTGVSREPFGVYFSTRTADQGQYIVFQDVNGNGAYDGASVDSRIDTLELRGNFYVAALTGPSGSSPDELSVTFERPDFDAFVVGGGVGETATIEIADGESGLTRQIIIGAGGYISVQ